MHAYVLLLNAGIFCIQEGIHIRLGKSSTAPNWNWHCDHPGGNESSCHPDRVSTILPKGKQGFLKKLLLPGLELNME